MSYPWGKWILIALNRSLLATRATGFTVISSPCFSPADLRPCPSQIPSKFCYPSRSPGIIALRKAEMLGLLGMMPQKKTHNSSDVIHLESRPYKSQCYGMVQIPRNPSHSPIWALQIPYKSWFMVYLYTPLKNMSSSVGMMKFPIVMKK